MNSIKENLFYIKNHLKNDVKIIAVSKGQDFDKIKQAYDLGIKDFGENYTKELLIKINLAKSFGMNISWHFLGNIQKNKIKFLSSIDYIHSITDFNQLDLLNKIAKTNVKYFLQINLFPNDKRLGFTKEFISENITKIANYKNINFIGLMCILPLNTNQDNSYWYTQMLNLKNDLENKITTKITLSMGMSKDFKDAIKYGSNFIRIGEGLFGKRHE